VARRLVSFLSRDLFPSNFLFESRRYWFTYPFVCSRNATDRDRGACMDVAKPKLALGSSFANRHISTFQFFFRLLTFLLFKTGCPAIASASGDTLSPSKDPCRKMRNRANQKGVDSPWSVFPMIESASLLVLTSITRSP